jgi:hypothetical protein
MHIFLENLDVYQAADGRVMIDADNNRYKIKWQEVKCDICGVPAKGTPFGVKPVCYQHWNTYAKEEERLDYANVRL